MGARQLAQGVLAVQGVWLGAKTAYSALPPDAAQLQAVVKALAKAAPSRPRGTASTDAEDDVDLLDPERVAAAGKAPATGPSAACAKDPHVPWLYQLPPGTDLHAAKEVERGEVVLQVRPPCGGGGGGDPSRR